MNVFMVLNDGVFLFHKFVVEFGFSLVGIGVFCALLLVGMWVSGFYLDFGGRGFLIA